MLPSLDYLGLPEKLIEDKEDFYRSGIQEASRIRNLCTVCQRLFITNSRNIKLYLLGEKDIYRIDVFESGTRKKLISQLYYLPKQLRLDIFDGGNPGDPLFMWKNKKCIYKNIPVLLDTIKVENMLFPLISIL
jgi:hypothetical protein